MLLRLPAHGSFRDHFNPWDPLLQALRAPDRWQKNGGKLSKEMADMAETFLFWSVLTTGSGHSGGFSTWQYKPFRNQTWPRETRLCYTSLPLEQCKFPWIPRTSWHKLEIGAKHQEGKYQRNSKRWLVAQTSSHTCTVCAIAI